MFKHSTKPLSLYLLAVFILLIQGCVPIARTPQDMNALLSERATALMDARVKKEYEKVYSFFTQDYKAEVKSSHFVNIPSRAETVSYTIDNIVIDPSGDKAKVFVTNDIRMSSMVFKGAKDTQEWRFENGNWYLFAKPVKGQIDD